MIKRLLLLNGFAILTVLLNHAAGWGYTAMFAWVHRYSAATPPDFSQVGSVSYYMLEIFRHLSIYSVPSFLFVSGFFIAYAARGSQGRLGWKVVWARLKTLLPPYVLWSVVIFGLGFALGNRESLLTYLAKLFTGDATPAYFFVPLLVQYYILSPVLVWAARKRWQLLLVVMGMFQLAAIGMQYLRLISPESLPFRPMPNWFFASSGLYFPMGIVVGLHLPAFKTWLARWKRALLVGAIVFALLTLVEQELLYINTSLMYGATFPSISSTFYTVFLLLAYQAYEESKIPYSKTLQQVANKSYGIYLVHPILLEITARLVYHFAPAVLAYQFIFQPLLVVVGLGLPILAMELLSRSPARKSYRYVFG